MNIIILLSGVDLPIKSNEYIHNFFNLHNGFEFIGFDNSKEAQRDIYDKTQLFHILTRCYKNNKFAEKLDRFWLKLQKLINVRKAKAFKYYAKGANWVSLTEECVEYLLSKKNIINAHFKYTKCADEIYKQTLIVNSKFKNSVYSMQDEYFSNQREVDWLRGNPYEYTADDFDILKNSTKIFARKFSDKSIEITILIRNLLNGNK